jgi:hypothetical protein
MMLQHGGRHLAHQRFGSISAWTEAKGSPRPSTSTPASSAAVIGVRMGIPGAPGDQIWNHIGLERFSHPIHLKGPIVVEDAGGMTVERLAVSDRLEGKRPGVESPRFVPGNRDEQADELERQPDGFRNETMRGFATPPSCRHVFHDRRDPRLAVSRDRRQFAFRPFRHLDRGFASEMPRQRRAVPYPDALDQMARSRRPPDDLHGELRIAARPRGGADY